ncbi:hypothetical protein [Burkholderia reimsis]|uniref:hypothetical protein n=1 Tax=Burkholderia reimsis TaxID=2234132 RepID=UPI001058FE7D|nr:hypothetical protein [Burkholderia reimsis]
MHKTSFVDLPPRLWPLLTPFGVTAGITAVSLALAVYCYGQSCKRDWVRRRTGPTACATSSKA